MATGELVSHDAATLHLTVTFQLDAAQRYVRFNVAGRNDAPHHRLRLRVHTEVGAGQAIADAAFLPVRRLTSGALPAGDAREAYPATMPLHRWVACTAPSGSAALLSDGLAECQVDDDGSIAVTLLRATGDLSRRNLPERPGHAGWPASTPEAQLIGDFDASFAFLPVLGVVDDAIVMIERACDDFLVPIQGETLLAATRALETTPPLTLEGDGLHFSSCKESEDGDGIVLRCVNTRSTPVTGAWSLGGVREAWLARLDETPVAALPLAGERIEFVAPPHAIVTILARASG
jgi:alpha-mannosidase